MAKNTIPRPRKRATTRAALDGSAVGDADACCILNTSCQSHPVPEGFVLRGRVDPGFRTTLPSPVRNAPGIRPGEDDLEWEIRGNVAIVRRAAERDATEQDPALFSFLRWLEHDIATHPERLRTMPENLRRRLRTGTGRVAVDLDEAIEGAVAL